MNTTVKNIIKSTSTSDSFANSKWNDTVVFNSKVRKRLEINIEV